ncbi:Methyl-accepting chemotaxis protein signaling domain [Verrucomicrobiia bacterium DG1235]|nr:Methyl-accepting chemotaxis protein signaling domain [Verrucomicrobiae bacterium DG1235]
MHTNTDRATTVKQTTIKWSITKLLTVTFGAVTFILAAAATWSFLGVNTLLSTSEQLIEANETDSHIAQLEADHLKWVQSLSFLFTDSKVTEVTVQTDHTQCNLGKWYHSSDRDELAKGHPNVATLLADIGPLHERLHNSAIEIGITYKQDNNAAIAQAADIFSNESIPALSGLQDLFSKLRSTLSQHSVTEETLLQEASSQRSSIAILASFAVVTTLCIAIFITRWVKTNLARSANAIQDASHAVSGAAEQVASGSISVADGSSKQASTLEETAAAMEEISAQTNNNREGAQKTGELAQVNLTAIDAASGNIDQLNTAIKSLFDNSKQIQTIVQSIDEIAFQTNILALNAAVEAARAGEAGAGFAVVADEVRALAQRAAASSQETATLIDNSVKHIDTSMDLTHRCSEDFSRIQDTSRDVRALVESVVKSSTEQAQGITQINLSVSQMDTIVQENAAGAEESASASNEMRFLAQSLETQVASLLTFAGLDKSSSKKQRPPIQTSTRPNRSATPAPKADPIWN